MAITAMSSGLKCASEGAPTAKNTAAAVGEPAAAMEFETKPNILVT
jgi:hypothetical protein